MNKLLLFGCSGNIGKAIASYFLKKNWQVTGVLRDKHKMSDLAGDDSKISFISFDPSNSNYSELLKSGPFDSVCWAQGLNCNDSIYDFDQEKHWEIYQANCLYILSSLNILLKESLLNNYARLCVISSVWQNISRQNKLSYTISKSAISGLIKSTATDLAKDKILINAVLPGAIDNEMTNTNLTSEQITKLKDATLFKSLPKEEDVASLVYFLCSSENKSISGQSIAVDFGFSNIKIV